MSAPAVRLSPTCPELSLKIFVLQIFFLFVLKNSCCECDFCFLDLPSYFCGNVGFQFFVCLPKLVLHLYLFIYFFFPKDLWCGFIHLFNIFFSLFCSAFQNLHCNFFPIKNLQRSLNYFRLAFKNLHHDCDFLPIRLVICKTAENGD